MQFAGKAEVRFGGILYRSLDGAKLDNPMAESRKGVKGAQPYGWTRDSEFPMITFDIPMSEDVDVVAFWETLDDVATFECDDGEIWTMPGATPGKIDLATGGDVAKYTCQIIGTEGPCTKSA